MKAEYIDHMGSDDAVVDAARVSFDKAAEMFTPEQNERLIKFLAKHNHWTPFGHCTVKLRMSAPVPIRTQCFKHKQGFVENEESRRYIKSMPELYIPEEFRMAPEGSIKQGSGGVHPDSEQLVKDYQFFCGVSMRAYEEWIERGVCPEQARFLLPQGVKVNWVWTGSLFAFANFYNKRSDAHAQKEIQMLAEEVSKIIEPLFPVSWAALTRQEVSTNA